MFKVKLNSVDLGDCALLVVKGAKYAGGKTGDSPLYPFQANFREKSRIPSTSSHRAFSAHVPGQKISRLSEYQLVIILAMRPISTNE